ncbi:MAG: ABC transporter ATP-binding protein, partial [Desulfobacterales bacterium]|nr:ABC transporter ATP-binding protein [Desulfobacterales bacterium]
IPAPGKTRPGQKLGSIPGIVPTPVGDLKGCSFRNRCSQAAGVCAERDVALVETSPGRAYRCALGPGGSATQNGRV